MKKNNNSGFTLIELLVVISIIALLSSIILASLSSARQKAKDAAVLEEVHQVQLAMELYNNDNNGFPNPTGFLGYYCLGAPTCTGPFGTVTNQLAISNFKYTDPEGPFGAAFWTPKVAEASTYTTTGGYLSQFTTLPTPLVIYCSTSGTLCPAANYYVWYVQGGVWQAKYVDTGTVTNPGS